MTTTSPSSRLLEACGHLRAIGARDALTWLHEALEAVEKAPLPDDEQTQDQLRRVGWEKHQLEQELIGVKKQRDAYRDDAEAAQKKHDKLLVENAALAEENTKLVMELHDLKDDLREPEVY